ncbi:hypothetical protein [Peribacillus sp. YIM B13477]|uniref:hypothetical protein n=1 Tax=Peribacillus sp. YIM B13477 TaxID=3366300 RepID=UPI00366B6F9D
MEENNEHNTSVGQENHDRRKLGAIFKAIPYWVWLILLFFGFPIILNLVIEYGKVCWEYVGDGEDWLGFFSNYAGGFIGAMVALIIAGKQGKEQRKLAEIQLKEQRKLIEIQLAATKEENSTQFERSKLAEEEKEAKQRKLAQLQPLIIAQYEIKEMIYSLKIVNIMRRESIKHIQDRDKKANTKERESEIKIEAEKNVYNIRPINGSLFSYIHLIEDMELQSKLFIKLSQYKDFGEALAINTRDKDWNYKPENGIDLKVAVYEAREINQRREMLVEKRKEEFWHFMDTGFVYQLENLLKKINSEIKDVEKIKNLNKDSSPENQ